MDICWELYYPFQKHCHAEHIALQTYLAGTSNLLTMNHQRNSPMSVVLNQIGTELKRNGSFNLGIMTQTELLQTFKYGPDPQTL